jgi:hypothetical protein
MLSDGFVVPLHEQFRRQMEHPFWLGGCSRSPDVSGQLLAQSSKKPLDMGHLAAGLSNLPVSLVFLEHRAVGFPEVAEASSLSVFLRNPAPEPSAGFCRTVSDNERYHLPGPTAQSDPQPPLIRTFPDVRPALIELKDVILFSWLEAFGYWVGFSPLFLSHRVNVLRLMPKIRLIARFDPLSR